MRVLILIGAAAVVLSSAAVGAEMTLHLNAVPRGSWVNPHYETYPQSIAGTVVLSHADDLVTPENALRGADQDYVFLPSLEIRDTAAGLGDPMTSTVRPEASARIPEGKTWCRSGVTAGKGVGFCLIN